MSFENILAKLSPERAIVLAAVRQHADQLLDHTPRFKFFTLHGREHLSSLFRILDLLIRSGIELSEREIYLLSLSICTHDLGMVASLRDLEFSDIAEGRPGFADPVGFENFIRDAHHNLIIEYVNENLEFLTRLGINAPDLATIIEIGKAHRKVDLNALSGVERKLGSLMRVIDELDIGPDRAPMALLENLSDEMDGISCWHWYKHSITSDWIIGHNVKQISEDGKTAVLFEIEVRPPSAHSIQYWLTQVHRPIRKVLQDEGAGEIIRREFGVELRIQRSPKLSRPSGLKGIYERLETRALSQGRQVILVIDDEAQKYDDLFYPLMDHFHVARAPNAKAAFQLLEASSVALAIVDIQLSSGGIWSAAETNDFKLTGVLITREILLKYPNVKIGVLTGTRHPLDGLEQEKLAFLARKPIDPYSLLELAQSAITSSK